MLEEREWRREALSFSFWILENKKWLRHFFGYYFTLEMGLS
jgi:hypothetical protein